MLLKSKNFLKLSRGSICELLKNEDVIVYSELEVFSAVIKLAILIIFSCLSNNKSIDYYKGGLKKSVRDCVLMPQTIENSKPSWGK
jgi:hypothetical protein